MSLKKKRRIAVKHYRDLEIRQELSRLLMIEHRDSADTLIAEEFGCNEARADMAVFNGSMHCYEIKSGFDKLDRLSNQIPTYSSIFDRVTLVADPIHLAKAKTLIPAWWGIIRVNCVDGEISFRQVRVGRRNSSLSATALSKMLWREEAYHLLKLNKLEKDLRKAPVHKIWQAVEDGLPVEKISNAVRTAIKRRGGSGFRLPLLQNDDSFPKQSSCQHSPSVDSDLL